MGEYIVDITGNSLLCCLPEDSDDECQPDFDGTPEGVCYPNYGPKD